MQVSTVAPEIMENLDTMIRINAMREIKENNHLIKGPFLLVVNTVYKNKLNILIIDTDTTNLDTIHIFEWEEKEQAIETVNRYNKIAAFA